MRKKTYIIASIIFILDQISKFIVINNFSYLESRTIIPSFFSLTYVKNTGGAFSILTDHVWLLALIGFVIFVMLLFYLHKQEITNWLISCSWGLILGGLLGNLVDRIFRNGVIDFLDFRFGTYHYPVFNVADIAIVIGIGLMIFLEVRGIKHEDRT